jgi:hypothetical protein
MPTQYQIDAPFVQQLTEQLHRQNLEVELPGGDFSHDLIVKNPQTNKRVFIEFKNSGHSGELPLTLAYAMYNQKIRLAADDRLFLITFATISEYLHDKLASFGIKSFAKPTPAEVAKQVKEAIAA